MNFKTPTPILQRNHARELSASVVLTHHATEMMSIRNIPKSAVLAIIAHGRWVPNHENELICWRGWCAVMDDNRVITVFYRKQWGYCVD